MGKEFSTLNAQPTLGIQTTNIYWPVRVNQSPPPVYMFRLDFWDVGYTSSTRYDYIDKVNSYFDQINFLQEILSFRMPSKHSTWLFLLFQLQIAKVLMHYLEQLKKNIIKVVQLVVLLASFLLQSMLFIDNLTI